jgi:hypothetical protein
MASLNAVVFRGSIRRPVSPVDDPVLALPPRGCHDYLARRHRFNQGDGIPSSMRVVQKYRRRHRRRHVARAREGNALRCPA